MRVVVTGAHGKVGRAAVRALLAAGHEVTAVDLTRPVWERPGPGEPGYLRADLTDAGQAFAVARGAEAVVHAAAIPDPAHDPPHVVFRHNLMATFNLIEAAVALGVPRFVNISSATVPGFFFADRPCLPAYAPIDEAHPIAPQDPYALSKHFGEQLMDAAVRRSDIRCVSLRPTWVQHEGTYERNLGPVLRDPYRPDPGLWSYVDVDDLADAVVLAVESGLTGHEVFCVASPDNAAGRELADLITTVYGEAIPIRPLSRPDASGVSSAKAVRLLGWRPSRSWRDHLDADGRALKGRSGA
ncbi:NAD-dependent epimerase/dehydratase family protein [Nonomuraea sp. CA-218870]|uniref:NAD-dependent epimerase/dehydratase family protein n=1 Tax=Nonomuraea sp. CA-218870 TaxID=3239998 RepID=UPI003D8CE0C8